MTSNSETVDGRKSHLDIIMVFLFVCVHVCLFVCLFVCLRPPHLATAGPVAKGVGSGVAWVEVTVVGWAHGGERGWGQEMVGSGGSGGLGQGGIHFLAASGHRFSKIPASRAVFKKIKTKRLI